MAEIVWTDAALADLESIRAYLAQFNPAAASRIALRLLAAAESLSSLAERGRPVGQDRRELVAVLPYVIRYRFAGETVFILRIRHGRRRPA